MVDKNLGLIEHASAGAELAMRSALVVALLTMVLLVIGLYVRL